MKPTERIAYSPITERTALELPGGARMVVWVIVNVEEWDILSPMPRTVLTPPAGGAPSPDIPNWAWHEYGNRVGFWRFVKIFDEFKIPAALAISLLLIVVRLVWVFLTAALARSIPAVSMPAIACSAE